MRKTLKIMEGMTPVEVSMDSCILAATVDVAFGRIRLRWAGLNIP